jgi:hypothetical protein
MLACRPSHEALGGPFALVPVPSINLNWIVFAFNTVGSSSWLPSKLNGRTLARRRYCRDGLRSPDPLPLDSFSTSLRNPWVVVAAATQPPCVASEPLCPQPAFVVRLTNYSSISAPHTAKGIMPLAQQRQLFRERLAALQELMVAVS